MKINELLGGVIYIEDAFPLSKKFIDLIEKNNNNKEIESVIPPWDEWWDGMPIDGVWAPTLQKGYLKDIDWDYTINKKNTVWPKINIDPGHSLAHSKSYDILKMIDDPYKKSLDVWSEKTGNSKIQFVTKNYTIKKYKTGMNIFAHADRDNPDDVRTPFDWTALIYLNDNYNGGALEFNNLGYSLNPSAGSIVFFSTDEVHTAHEVTAGNKYFIFCYINSKLGYTHSVNEDFFIPINHISGKTIF